jgi:hypothetical protein
MNIEVHKCRQPKHQPIGRLWMPSVRRRAMPAVGSRGGTRSTDIEAGGDGTATSAAGRQVATAPRLEPSRFVLPFRRVSFLPLASQPHLERALGGRPRLGHTRCSLARSPAGREGGGLGLARRSAACRGVGWGVGSGTIERWFVGPDFSWLVIRG